MAENLSLYKLIVLYMLHLTEGPMTAAHISDFILGKDYTDYFTLQQSLSDLESSELVYTQTTNNATLFSISEKGKETLHFFEDRLSEGIRNDIFEYLRNNEITIRKDVSAVSEFYKTTDGRYAAHCRLQEDGVVLVDLTLSCQTRSQAEAVCAQWKTQNFDVYTYLMDHLLK